MSAKEMFGKLGYKIITNDERTLEYFKEEKDSRYTIEFNKLEKLVGFYFEMYSKFNNWWNYELASLDLKELQAINKQVEELGWLDE